MFKKRILWLIGLFYFSLLPAAQAKVQVVATLPTLGALAAAVGGPLVTVKTLASAYEDPHFVDPRPNYVLEVNKADLLIYNGMELEIGWLPAVLKNARNNRVNHGAPGSLDASTAITPLQVPAATVDRSQGDVHGQGNPHYLYSLPQAMLVAAVIAEKLATIDPGNREQYQRQLADFLARAKARENFWRERFKQLSPERRRIVSYHDSLIYLTTWLGLASIGTVEQLPGVAPGPAHVKNLLLRLKKEPVKYIMQENYQPRNTSEKIAGMIGAKVVIIDPGPAPEEAYLDYVERTLQQFFK